MERLLILQILVGKLGEFARNHSYTVFRWGSSYSGPFNTQCFIEKSENCIKYGVNYASHFDNLDKTLLDSCMVSSLLDR
jgi:hypothetical protein